jgi:hypothetical protein
MAMIRTRQRAASQVGSSAPRPANENDLDVALLVNVAIVEHGVRLAAHEPVPRRLALRNPPIDCVGLSIAQTSWLASGAQAAAHQTRLESPHRPVRDETRSSPVGQVGPDPLEKHGRSVPPSG